MNNIFNNKFLPSRQSKLHCIILVLILVGIYAFENSPILALTESRLLNYIAKPLLWGSLVLVVLLFPKVRPKGKLSLRRHMYLWAFNLSVIYVITLVIAGVIDGLGKSPYSHSPIGILTNVIYITALVLGRELVRNYLINDFSKEENYIVFVLVALLMTCTSIPLNQFLKLEENIDIVKFIAQYFAPEFAHNLLACYLVFLGGPFVAIIYMGIIHGFHWLSPVLPDLKWITKALIGILYPIFSLMTIQSIYLKESRTVKRRDQDDENPLSWIITSIISIGIIWFAVGVFPVYPSVIATGSMEPMIKPGDVIIVQKIDGNDVDVGDVIQFRRDDILISHRVIEIVYNDNIKSYRTMGDNNGGPDSKLVNPEQVKGEIKYVVPKIGWLTLLIKSEDEVPIEEIEF